MNWGYPPMAPWFPSENGNPPQLINPGFINPGLTLLYLMCFFFFWFVISVLSYVWLFHFSSFGFWLFYRVFSLSFSSLMFLFLFLCCFFLFFLCFSFMLILSVLVLFLFFSFDAVSFGSYFASSASLWASKQDRKTARKLFSYTGLQDGDYPEFYEPMNHSIELKPH